MLAAVKEDAALRDILVVELTASIDPADRADVKHFDVAAYLTKPVNLEQFLWLVQELKQLWLSEVILPHVDEVAETPPDGAPSSGGSLGLFK